MEIKPIGLFDTPKDWDELMDWINRHHEDSRSHLITAAGKAWNLAAHITQSEKKENNDD